MSRIDWLQLMRAGMCELGLKPHEFWALTPAELAFLATGGQPTPSRMSRDRLSALMAQFPDGAERDI